MLRQKHSEQTLRTRQLTANRNNADFSVKMMCSRVFQPSFGHLMDFHWPVRSLWPQIQPLFVQEEMLLRHMQEMRNSLDQLDRLQHRIFEEINQVPTSQTIQPVSYKLEKDGDHFALTLDTKDFSPEDLTVKQVGRKLQVCGKMEKKQDDGNGSSSYKIQEFRQEFDLPEGVNPNAVTCSLSDGQLRIQAPTEALAEGAERVVPIDCSPGEKTLQFQSSQAESSTEETQNHQQGA
ncbi:heat shock protein 30-like [Anguilla rostrata]|uniref:heat shock protein 30-like n=1 Tax=Anguilla rostrata TaxID=7938 RepID=UPI0030CC2152